MKLSGAHCDTSFSESELTQAQTNEHTTNSKSVIQTTANSRPVRVRTDAERSITTARYRGIAQISGPNYSRVAKQLASNVASVAPVTRVTGHDGVRRGCRQFF